MQSARVKVELNRLFLDKLVESGLGGDHESAFNHALFFALFLARYKDAYGCLQVRNDAPDGFGELVAIEAYAPRDR